MKYTLSEQELKDLMHRSWLKAKKFYNGKTDEYFYDYFESEKKQLPIHVVSNRRELLIDCVRTCLQDEESVTVEQQVDTYLHNKGN